MDSVHIYSPPVADRRIVAGECPCCGKWSELWNHPIACAGQCIEWLQKEVYSKTDAIEGRRHGES